LLGLWWFVTTTLPRSVEAAIVVRSYFTRLEKEDLLLLALPYSYSDNEVLLEAAVDPLELYEEAEELELDGESYETVTMRLLGILTCGV
jgi:hypothetical protein